MSNNDKGLPKIKLIVGLGNPEKTFLKLVTMSATGI